MTFAVRLYIIIGITAIVGGAMLSAFTAKQPTTFAMWASAYLVLIAGVAQVGGGLALHTLVSNASQRLLHYALLLFNIGNTFVIAGSAVKYDLIAGDRLLFVTFGSSSLVAALALLGFAVRRTKQSRTKVLFYSVLILIAVSIPIGMLLSQH